MTESDTLETHARKHPNFAPSPGPNSTAAAMMDHPAARVVELCMASFSVSECVLNFVFVCVCVCV